MKPVLAVAVVAVLALSGLAILSRGAILAGAQTDTAAPDAAAGKAADAAVDTAVQVAKGVAQGAAAAVTQAVTDAASAASDGAVSPPAPAAPAAVAGAQPSWRAAELTPEQIKQRIADADIAETDRLALMQAFREAQDAAGMQAVLDKLRLAIAAHHS